MISLDAIPSEGYLLLTFADAEIFLINSPKRLEISRFLTMVFLKDINYARDTVAKYPPNYNILLDWLKEAEKDSKIKTDNLLLAAECSMHWLKEP